MKDQFVAFLRRLNLGCFVLFRVFQNARTLHARSGVRAEMLQIAAFWVAQRLQIQIL